MPLQALLRRACLSVCMAGICAMVAACCCYGVGIRVTLLACMIDCSRICILALCGMQMCFAVWAKLGADKGFGTVQP